MPGECRGADRGGLSIGAVLKRHVPRCSKRIGTNQFTLQDVKVATRNAKAERDRTGSLIPEPKAAGAPRLARRLIGGVWGEQNLSAPPRSPAPWESGQGAAGRPPLGPGCATAPRAPAGDERVAGGGTAGHARAATLPDDGPSVAVGQGSATARPLKGRAATASSMGPRLIRELPLGHSGRGRPPPRAYACSGYHHPHRRSETTLPCASTTTAS